MADFIALTTVLIGYTNHTLKTYSNIWFSELLKVKSKAKAKGELKEVASICNVLGELFQQQGKYEDAVSEHKVPSVYLNMTGRWDPQQRMCTFYFEFYPKLIMFLRKPDSEFQIFKRNRNNIETWMVNVLWRVVLFFLFFPHF